MVNFKGTAKLFVKLLLDILITTLSLLSFIRIDDNKV